MERKSSGTKVWSQDLLPLVAEAAGADIEEEVAPIVSAFLSVLAQTLAEGHCVGLKRIGSFKPAEGTSRIEFIPSRRRSHT